MMETIQARWLRPVGGVRLFDYRAGRRGDRPHMLGRSTLSASYDPRPRSSRYVRATIESAAGSSVLAPVELEKARWEWFEPELVERAQLVNELQRLDLRSPDRLARFASRWGMFGGEDMYNEHDRDIWFQFMNGIRTEVRKYQRSLALEDPNPVVARELKRFGVTACDPVTLEWGMARCPMALAWAELRASLVENMRPRRCPQCKRFFTPRRTDRRRSGDPPRYCSDTCRSNAAHARLASGGEPRESGRPGKRPRRKR